YCSICGVEIAVCIIFPVLISSLTFPIFNSGIDTSVIVTGASEAIAVANLVTWSFEPTTAKVAYFDLINMGTQKEIRDNSGNLTGLILTLTAS
ncbi:hypothetical protein ABXW85_18660, partial [Streptococcus suis]